MQNRFLPPKLETPVTNEKKVNSQVTEKKIQEIINRGGQPTNKSEQEQVIIKCFTLRLPESMLRDINALRAKLPKVGRRKIAISLEGWMLEAIQERIEKDQKKYVQI